MKALHRTLTLGAALLAGSVTMSAHAATAVSWTSPANNTAYPTGTAVAPTGNASATGQTASGLDLALVLDSSGSMISAQTVNGVTKTRQQWQKDNAIALVNSLFASSPTTTSISIVEFDSDANTIKQLTALSGNQASIIASINSVDASGGTTIGSGIDAATTELTSVRHTSGRSQQMIVFSDGSTSGTPNVNTASALTAGVDYIHSVALPGANLSTMQGIANVTGNPGIFVDASTAAGLAALEGILTGSAGSLVGIDHVDVTTPDGTVTTVAVDGFGNFTSPTFNLNTGNNLFVAKAYATDGTTATQNLNLIGTTVPEPGTLALIGLGLLGFAGSKRRKV